MLYLMAGCPGSGKSTWLKKHAPQNSVIVSRDKIRFELVAEDEPYFSKEQEVFNKYVNSIKASLALGLDVVADATHLTVASRRKLLNAVGKKNYRYASVIWIKSSLATAIRQNERRVGSRSYVPVSTIRKMYHSFEPPTFEEDFHRIYIVEPGVKINILKNTNEGD